MVIAQEPVPSDDLKACPLSGMCREVIVLSAPGVNDPARRRFNPWTTIGNRIRNIFASPFPNQIQAWFSSDVVHALNRLRRSQSFESVWVERPFLAELARKAGFRHLMVDVDNIESVCLFRQLWHSPSYLSKVTHYADFLKMWLYELMLPWRYQRLIVCKEEDRYFFKTRRNNVFVVPNGVEDFPKPSRTSECPNGLLFVGSMNYEPNIDAVRYFVDEIAPYLRSLAPEARLRVVGRGPFSDPKVSGNDIVSDVELDVPDVAPYFADAAVVVAPIRLGSGTRLKILESLARGKAVVATPTAVEGLDLTAGEDIEIAANPVEFAAACARLLSDPDARARLGDSGRRKVLRLYRWENIGRIAERIVNSQVKGNACVSCTNDYQAMKIKTIFHRRPGSDA